MTRRRQTAGFNMIELLLALTLISIAALTLVALSFTAISARQKAENITDAMLVAEEQLSLAVQAIETLPASEHDSFWGAALSEPISEGEVRIAPADSTETAPTYNFRVTATDVPTGTSAPNRLRKLDILVWWWSENPGEGRVGSGQLTYSASRLVREVKNDEPAASP